MNLITSFFIDILPQDDNCSIDFYKKFVFDYTIITVTSSVTQLSLMHTTYDGMEKKELEKTVDSIIDNLPSLGEQKRSFYRALCYGAMMNPGKVIQEEENRIFISDLFKEHSKMHNMSNKDMIIKGLNRSAFLNYFFLFEDTLKNIYFENLSNLRNTHIGGSLIISTTLKNILEYENILNEFNYEMSRRSKIFLNFKSLENFWILINFIRNRLVHYNGYYDNKAERKFNKYFNDFLECYKKEEYFITIITIINVFEVYQKQISNSKYLIIDDILENILRNINLFIIESLYICRKNKLIDKGKK